MKTRYIQPRRRGIPLKKKQIKANWVGHIFRRNCLLKHVIEGKIRGRIKVTGRRRRRCKQLLYELTEKRGYWKLRKEALDHTLKNSVWYRLLTCKARLRNG